MKAASENRLKQFDRLDVAGLGLASVLFLTALIAWPSAGGAVTGIVLGVLVLCATIDIKEMRIPNPLTYSGTLLLLVASVLSGRDAFADALLGAALGGGIIGLMSLVSRGQVGLGDAKLSVVGGSLAGGAYVLPALLVGTLSAIPVFAFLLLSSRIHRRQAVPYGPYLSLGFIVVTFVAGSVLTR